MINKVVHGQTEDDKLSGGGTVICRECSAKASKFLTCIITCCPCHLQNTIVIPTLLEQHEGLGTAFCYQSSGTIHILATLVFNLEIIGITAFKIPDILLVT